MRDAGKALEVGTRAQLWFFVQGVIKCCVVSKIIHPEVVAVSAFQEDGFGDFSLFILWQILPARWTPPLFKI